jgi:hypothetical protein
MKKLSQIEAGNLISKAWSDVRKYSINHYRFGQSLFNQLPQEMARAITNTEMDFFYEVNHEEVGRLFYLHCVENDE